VVGTFTARGRPGFHLYGSSQGPQPEVIPEGRGLSRPAADDPTTATRSRRTMVGAPDQTCRRGMRPPQRANQFWNCIRSIAALAGVTLIVTPHTMKIERVWGLVPWYSYPQWGTVHRDAEETNTAVHSCANTKSAVHTGCGPLSSPLSVTVRQRSIFQGLCEASFRRSSPLFVQVGIRVGITSSLHRAT
jgi:hypothetical protein